MHSVNREEKIKDVRKLGDNDEIAWTSRRRTTFLIWILQQ